MMSESVSTNLVLINETGEIYEKLYLNDERTSCRNPEKRAFEL